MLSPVSKEDLLAQFANAMRYYKNEGIVKVFTSGSFLDPSELPEPVQHEIVGTLSEKAEKISVESRPEYIKETRLKEIKKNVSSKEFEIGIGLETSNDLVREKAINKGFTFQEYVHAATRLKKHQMNVKTYVLLKPPFLTEKESLNDCIRTIKDIIPYTDTVSLNPTNVQRHTVVEYLWKRNQYRPPWLWSIVEILQHSKTMTNAFLKCDVVGGGSMRGAHNCGTCDRGILQAIAEFSLTQKQDALKDLSCNCYEKWRDQLDLEQLSFGSVVDFARGSL
jgi:radical SAM enzyme (TIGR01210 family)